MAWSPSSTSGLGLTRVNGWTGAGCAGAAVPGPGFVRGGGGGGSGASGAELAVGGVGAVSVGVGSSIVVSAVVVVPSLVDVDGAETEGSGAPSSAQAAYELPNNAPAPRRTSVPTRAAKRLAARPRINPGSFRIGHFYRARALTITTRRAGENQPFSGFVGLAGGAKSFLALPH
jgi:hypothetical protein